MKKLIQLTLALTAIALFALVGACSVDLTETQTAQGFATRTPTVPPPPSLTPTIAPTEPPTLTPTATQPDDPTLTPTPSPTPTIAFPFSTVEAEGFNLQVIGGYPPELQGHLLFLSTLESGLQAVVSLDLETGEAAPLFVAESKAWLLSLSVASNLNEILVSYAPPPEEGKPSYGYTDLYVLKPDGQVTPVLERAEDVEAYFGAFLNPAGDFVYYSHFLADSTAPSGFRYHINRVAYKPGSGAAIGASTGVGTPEVVVENAFWERMSPDGTKLAYVTFDGREFDELFVTDADGSNPVRALDPEEFPTIDAPFFSPDNQFLYFSAVSQSTPALSWWEKLMGVQIVFARSAAHSVPSDFWRVSLVDGSVMQITQLKDQGMFGTFSPDGKMIAFITATGLYIMQPDGIGLVKLMDSANLYGNVEWVP